MTLNNYQFQFGETFQFGGAGSPFQIASVEGLEDLPDMRVQDADRGFNDGMFTGRDFYSGRNLTFDINVFAGNGNSAQQNLALLQQYLIPQQQGTQTLQFLLSATDTEKQLNARVRGRKVTIDPEFTYGFIRTQVEMFCPDPRYYDNVLQTLNLSPNPVVNGRTYDRVYPLDFGGGTNQNYGTATNSGWVYTSPTAVIHGPITNPIFGYTEANVFIQVMATLGAYDQLEIDLNEKIITLNGSPVRNLMTTESNWFTIPANTSATLYIAGVGMTAGVTTLAVNWRNAYI